MALGSQLKNLSKWLFLCRSSKVEKRNLKWNKLTVLLSEISEEKELGKKRWGDAGLLLRWGGGRNSASMIVID